MKWHYTLSAPFECIPPSEEKNLKEIFSFVFEYLEWKIVSLNYAVSSVSMRIQCVKYVHTKTNPMYAQYIYILFDHI